VVAYVYADDNLLIFEADRSASIQHQVKRTIGKVSSILRDLDLKLNYNKTDVLVFYDIGKPCSRRQIDTTIHACPTFHYGTHRIEEQTSIKYLRAVIDEKMT
jgi:hypothetical protein